jgi:RNA polymerase sigma factor for flagellar operon FliA
MSAPFATEIPAREAGDQITEHLPFVRRVVARMARRLPSHVRLDDLMGAGVVGLLEAFERYDPRRGSSFQTFAEFRVKGAVLDELRRRDIMARDARLAAKRIERTFDELTQTLGRRPEEEEVAKELGMPLAEYRSQLEKLTPVRVLSLEDALPAGPRDSGASPFDAAAKSELRQRLAAAVAELSERHQKVLQLYYCEDLTLREIGELIGVTESRVCQIVSEATLRLRAFLGVSERGTQKKRGRHG